MAQILGAHPFGLLIVPIAGEDPLITHMPMIFDPERGEHGTIVGHLARPNPIAKSEADRAIAVFTGPHGYVSPRWYPDRGEESSVPTWNYEAIYARGRLRRVHGEGAARIVARMAAHFEAARPDPWILAPDDPRITGLVRGIVGLELEIERIDFKAKLGQNRTIAEREGVIAGLEAAGGAESLGLAEAMGQRIRKAGG